MEKSRAGFHGRFLVVRLVAFALGMISLRLAFASQAQPCIPTSWIFPQPTTLDHLSKGEQKKFEKAWKNFNKGKIDKAKKDWDSLLKRHLDSSALLTALSYVDFSQDHLTLAVSKLEAAVNFNTKFVPALETLSRYFTANKDYQSAYRYTSALASAQPNDSRMRSRLEELRLLATEDWIAKAHAARSKGAWAEAEADYLHGIADAPELATLPRELGEIYGYEEKWDKAEQSYLKAIQLDPSDVEAKKKLAEVYLRTHQRDKAERMLQNLAARSNQDQGVRSMLDNLLTHGDPLEVALANVRQKPRISRGDFGALLALRFPFLKEFLKSPPAILTDLKSHWGKAYLPLIAGLNIIPSYPNHQFRPNAMIRREEVATAIQRILMLMNLKPAFESASIKIVDVPRTNPHRSAIVEVVALGWMTTDTSDRFHPLEGISGNDALNLLQSVEQYLRLRNGAGAD